MVRTNRRKGIEEVYGSKLETLQPGRHQAIPQPGMTKTASLRVNSSRQGDSRPHRSYVTPNDYYITTNVPLNSTNMRAAPSSILAHSAKSGLIGVQVPIVAGQPSSYGSTSNRRSKASTRQQQQQHPQQQHPQQQQQPQQHPQQQTGQQAKAHFEPPEGKVNRQQARPLPHHQSYSSSIPLQMTQRTVYAQASEMDPSIVELLDKDAQIRSSSSRRSHAHSHQNSIGNPHHSHAHPQSLSLSGHLHAHPMQHQLHQQQQQLPSNNNVHSSIQQMHQQKHSNLKIQQQQQLQQQQQQQVLHHQRQQHLLQLQQQQQQQQLGAGHQRQCGAMQMPVVTEEEDEKDDDPEEFFELIRQTVGKAVATTLSDVVSRNFRDLGNKMERISNDLKLTNNNLGKLQAEVTNKVMHYGEENTRHFRYLCMKSEYDKMFYQQQALTVGKPAQAKSSGTQAVPSPKLAPTSNRVSKQAAAFNMKCAKQLTGRKMGYSHLKKASPVDCVKKQNTCGCHDTSKASLPQDQLADQQHSSSERSMTVKTSQIDEVLGQLQRLCTKMNAGDMKEEQLKYKSQIGMFSMDSHEGHSSSRGKLTSDQLCSTSKADIVDQASGSLDMDLGTPVDSMDETKIENFQSSSDDMFSYSDDDSEVKFSGKATARMPIQSPRSKLTMVRSNNGAGDGQ